MAPLNPIVDSLESKLHQLISAHKALKKDHQLLSEAFSKLEQLRRLIIDQRKLYTKFESQINN